MSQSRTPNIARTHGHLELKSKAAQLRDPILPSHRERGAAEAVDGAGLTSRCRSNALLSGGTDHPTRPSTVSDSVSSTRQRDHQRGRGAPDKTLARDRQRPPSPSATPSHPPAAASSTGTRYQQRAPPPTSARRNYSARGADVPTPANPPPPASHPDSVSDDDTTVTAGRSTARRRRRARTLDLTNRREDSTALLLSMQQNSRLAEQVSRMAEHIILEKEREWMFRCPHPMAGAPAPYYPAPFPAPLPAVAAAPCPAPDAGADVSRAAPPADILPPHGLPLAAKNTRPNFVFAAAMQHMSPLPPANSARLDFPPPPRRSPPNGQRQDRRPASARSTRSRSPCSSRPARYAPLRVTGDRPPQPSDHIPWASNVTRRTVVSGPTGGHRTQQSHQRRADSRRDAPPTPHAGGPDTRTRLASPPPPRDWQPADAHEDITRRKPTARGYRRHAADAQTDSGRHAHDDAHPTHAQPSRTVVQTDDKPAPNSAAPSTLDPAPRPGPCGNPPDNTTIIAEDIYKVMRQETGDYEAHLHALGRPTGLHTDSSAGAFPLLTYWGSATTPTSSQDPTPLTAEARADRLLVVTKAPESTPPRSTARLPERGPSATQTLIPNYTSDSSPEDPDTAGPALRDMAASAPTQPRVARSLHLQRRNPAEPTPEDTPPSATGWTGWMALGPTTTTMAQTTGEGDTPPAPTHDQTTNAADGCGANSPPLPSPTEPPDSPSPSDISVTLDDTPRDDVLADWPRSPPPSALLGPFTPSPLPHQGPPPPALEPSTTAHHAACTLNWARLPAANTTPQPVPD